MSLALALPRLLTRRPAGLHTKSYLCVGRHFPGGMRVLVKGFVSNMAEWMSACNVIVTKAGPGTIAEALICGLPIVLNGFIPCQARGTCVTADFFFKCMPISLWDARVQPLRSACCKFCAVAPC